MLQLYILSYRAVASSLSATALLCLSLLITVGVSFSLSVSGLCKLLTAFSLFLFSVPMFRAVGECARSLSLYHFLTAGERSCERERLRRDPLNSTRCFKRSLFLSLPLSVYADNNTNGRNKADRKGERERREERGRKERAGEEQRERERTHV